MNANKLISLAMGLLIAPGCTTKFDTPEDSHADTHHDPTDTNEIGPDTEPPSCGGPGGVLCPEGWFCDIDWGLCNPWDYVGWCVPVPTACPDTYEPVCGCDGVTYTNDCYRQQALQLVAYYGECLVPCDPFMSGSCQDDYYCEAPAGLCGLDDIIGVCVPRTPDCEYSGPQCGCDGISYNNACDRRAAGALLDHEGSCGIRGCISNMDCPSGSPQWFCEFEPGACTVTPNAHCVPVPEWCDPMEDYPVCGCDNTPWANNCFRRQAMAQIAGIGGCY